MKFRGIRFNPEVLKKEDKYTKYDYENILFYCFFTIMIISTFALTVLCIISTN